MSLCAGRHACAVDGCPCKVPRRAPVRVRICVCCVARLHPRERNLFGESTQASPTVRAVLKVLAGDLALEREDQKREDDAAAAVRSPFLEELDPETRARLEKLL